jgi:hypothetical protein
MKKKKISWTNNENYPYSLCKLKDWKFYIVHLPNESLF